MSRAEIAMLDAMRGHEQGVELLCVSLNESPGAARLQLAGKDVPGVHVFQRGGTAGV